MAQAIPLSPQAQSVCQAQFLVVQSAQRILEALIRGYLLGLGLEGDYSLDVNTWALVPMPDNRQEPNSDHVDEQRTGIDKGA